MPIAVDFVVCRCTDVPEQAMERRPHGYFIIEGIRMRQPTFSAEGATMLLHALQDLHVLDAARVASLLKRVADAGLAERLVADERDRVWNAIGMECKFAYEFRRNPPLN
jgi:hypothetical protein